MLPAAVLLLLFLTYPLGLGTWLGFTDAKIGRAGEFGSGSRTTSSWSATASTQLALFNTLFYTVVASVLKFVLGLWLALLLNRNLPFKTFFRAVVLLPWIVPTALSAIAFWWIYDAQFSIISWVLVKHGLIDRYIDFLGDPWNARLVDHRRQRLARHPVRRHLAAGRAADHLALALRGLGDRRRHALAAVPPRHAAAAHADHRGGDDLLGAVHLHRLPADLRAHPRRAAQRHAPDGDAVLPARASPAARSARARRSPPRWCRSCWRRSCSATSACSGAPGSRAGDK